MTAAKGVARFVSGSGPSPAYQVRTPHATIGVRGTVFDVLVQRGRTVVVHGQGAIEVCPRLVRRSCEIVTLPGDVVIVTASAILGPASAASRALDVARLRSQLGGDTIASLAPMPISASVRGSRVASAARALRERAIRRRRAARARRARMPVTTSLRPARQR